MASVILLLALLSESAGATTSNSLRAVDDTGKEIREPLRVCLYQGAETECLEQAPYRIPEKLAAFTSATAEGPGHGPVAIERRMLVQEASGAYLLSVPRKALVALRTSPGPPVALSLYSADDPSFRKPSFRFPGVTLEGVRVPAGEFLVTFADGTNAPAVSTLTLKPGSRNSFVYARLPGWSVVLRCASPTAPVRGCLVQALSASTPAAQRELGRASADRHGIATFTGVTQPFITLALSAAGFVPQEARGIAARPGTFAFHAATLTRGGIVRARVTLDDQPARSARCQLLDLHGSDVGPPTEETLYDGKTTKEGVCETAQVAVGSYVLRISRATTGNAADEPVTVKEGGISEVNVSLRSLRVTGKVYRGTRPAPGVVVRIARREDLERRSSIYLELDTTDDGEYRGEVWSTGEYMYAVMNAARSAVGAVQRVTVGEDGAETDLYLNPYDITGRVQDDRQRPVPDATVLLTRNEGIHRATKAGSDGTFGFPMDGGGEIRITSQKTGFRPGEAVEFQLATDAAPPPVVLTLKKLPSIKGTVFWPSGSPAADLGIASFQVMPGQAPAPLGVQRTDPAGGFELPSAPAGMTQVFAIGQGCPLLISNAPSETEDLVLRCPAQSAGVQLVLRDPAGAPRPHESVILRWEGMLIPRDVLRDHLLLLGLPRETDGAGRLVLVGLPAGAYDIFLGRGASEATVAAGLQYGYLTSAALRPFDTPEIEITVQ